MTEPRSPRDVDPIDIFLGALNMVALPLVRGEDGEEMSETAQFYGFEDFGGHFKNVSPRITELAAYRPTAERPGCVIAFSTPRLLIPGALTRAAGRWAKAYKLAPDGAKRWRGAGLVLTLDMLGRQNGRTRARAVLARDT